MATFNREKKSGIIFIYQSIDGARFKQSTGIKVDEKDWNGDKAKTNLVKFNGKSVNSQLVTCELYLNMAIADLTTEGGDMNRLKELYIQHSSGKRTIRHTGNKFMEYFKADYEAQQSSGTSTWKHYRTTYRILEEFFKSKDPVFDQIDATFYRDFMKWLQVNKQSMVSTMGGHIKRIKAIMRKASAEGLHKNNKFENFKRPKYETDKVALSPIELDKIAFTVLPQDLELIKDYFLLSCYTGARISDWDQLSISAIKDGLWKYKANKTKETAIVRITPKVIAILEKYKGKLPEKPADQTVNEKIKEVCRLAGLTENYTTTVERGGKIVSETSPRWKLVTSHTGRRTFATILILKGAPIHLIMMQTGHKTLTSFEGYIKLKELQAEKALKDSDVVSV